MSSICKWAFKNLTSLCTKDYPRNFLIAGEPKSGKTKLIQDLYWHFVEKEDFEANGFVTGHLNKISPEFEDEKSRHMAKQSVNDTVAIMTLDEERIGRGQIS